MTSPNATDALLQKARKAANNQNIDEAIATAQAAALADPSRADVWKFLGTLHFQRGALAQASDAFRNALRANPGDTALSTISASC
jgi:cytochrome c-type biogenesis protein CcmH/NrfG